MKKKFLCLFLSLVVACGAIYFADAADTGLCDGVTDEMCNADYWKNISFGDPDEILMTADDIAAFNQNAIDSKATYVMGIETMAETYNADSQRKRMQFTVPTRDLYINGEKIDNESYYNKINTAILETGYTEEIKDTGYAICVRSTDMKYIPTVDKIGYSADDTDDEMEYENMSVNEPFLIRGECTIDSVKFYYGYSLDCPGWVPADDFAICTDKQEWLDAWKFDIDGKNFLVVTQNEITLEPSAVDDYSSSLFLNMSTALKLIPDDEIPETIGGRNTWNNYAVYVPTKNSEGMYEAKPALISQHYSVSIGYLPFTQSNILDVAFGCLGDSYGWAGMMNMYDCSLFTRSVYRCFGLNFPRNATWQQNVSGTKIDLSDKTDDEKQKILETLPSGTVLFFKGHTMMYLGSVDSTAYVMSALGTVVNPTGDENIQSVYNITITPLTVRRGKSYNYTTWLSNLSSAVMVMPPKSINSDNVTVNYTKDSDNINVILTANGIELTEGLHYTVSDDGEKITVEGINSFTGTNIKNISDISENNDSEEDQDKNDKTFWERMLEFLNELFYRIKNVFRHIFELLKF